MTLREKFQQEPVVVYQESFILTNQSAEYLQEIADDYAIEFSEWLLINTYMQGTISYKTCMLSSQGKDITTKELLEIFKKEKGL